MDVLLGVGLETPSISSCSHLPQLGGRSVKAKTRIAWHLISWTNWFDLLLTNYLLGWDLNPKLSGVPNIPSCCGSSQLPDYCKVLYFSCICCVVGCFLCCDYFHVCFLVLVCFFVLYLYCATFVVGFSSTFFVGFPATLFVGFEALCNLFVFQ